MTTVRCEANEPTGFRQPANPVIYKTGWVIDENGIYATIDGGKHWGKITPNTKFIGIEDLTLISPSVGFVTTFVPASDKSSEDTWKLYKTTDGGHNWFKVDLIS